MRRSIAGLIMLSTLLAALPAASYGQQGTVDLNEGSATIGDIQDAVRAYQTVILHGQFELPDGTYLTMDVPGVTLKADAQGDATLILNGESAIRVTAPDVSVVDLELETGSPAPSEWTYAVQVLSAVGGTVKISGIRMNVQGSGIFSSTTTDAALEITGSDIKAYNCIEIQQAGATHRVAIENNILESNGWYAITIDGRASTNPTGPLTISGNTLYSRFIGLELKGAGVAVDDVPDAAGFPAATITGNNIHLSLDYGGLWILPTYMSYGIWLGVANGKICNVTVRDNVLRDDTRPHIDLEHHRGARVGIILEGGFSSNNRIVRNDLSQLTTWDTQINVNGQDNRIERNVLGNAAGPVHEDMPGYWYPYKRSGISLQSYVELDYPAPEGLPLPPCTGNRVINNDYTLCNLPGWGDESPGGCLSLWNYEGGQETVYWLPGAGVYGNFVVETKFPMGRQEMCTQIFDATMTDEDPMGENHISGWKGHCLGLSGEVHERVLQAHINMLRLRRPRPHRPQGPPLAKLASGATRATLEVGNTPNPFNPSTTVRYALPEPSVVRLTVFNLLGQQVRQLVASPQSAGPHSIRWDGTDSEGRALTSGVYLYRLEAGSEVLVRKMLLLK